MVLLYRLIHIFVIPQQQQLGEEEVEAEVKTSRIVDLGVPATEQEGEDGQSEEEQPDDHTHPV